MLIRLATSISGVIDDCLTPSDVLTMGMERSSKPVSVFGAFRCLIRTQRITWLQYKIGTNVCVCHQPHT